MAPRSISRPGRAPTCAPATQSSTTGRPSSRSRRRGTSRRTGVLVGWWTDGADVARAGRLRRPDLTARLTRDRLSRAGRPGALATGPLRVPRRAGEHLRVADRLPDPARLTVQAPEPGTGRHARRLRLMTTPTPGGTARRRRTPMTQSQTLRTLGAGALGAFVVAIAALSVRTGPVSGAPAADTPATHTITVSATGKVTVIPDVARVYLGVTVTKPTVKAARDAGAKAMTDIIAALKALGIADADIQTTNLSLYPQYGNSSPRQGHRLPDQRTGRGHRPRPRQGGRRGRRRDREGRDRRQRHLVRGRRPGQGPERRAGRRRRGRPGQRPGDGDRRSRLARRGRLDHRRDPGHADLLRPTAARGPVPSPTWRPPSSPARRT